MGFVHVVDISARDGIGIDKLVSSIESIVWKNSFPSIGEAVITCSRHKEALNRSIDACSRVIVGLKEGISPEFLSIDLRECLSSLAAIIGTDVTEDILSSIFSKFCVGK
jgi:tRNA modification GTPase